MRILWLGHNLAYPPKGGVLQRNYNLLREAAKSCEVHVLAFDQPATRPLGVTAEDCVRALREFCASVEWVPLPRQLSGTDLFSSHETSAVVIDSRRIGSFPWLERPAYTLSIPHHVLVVGFCGHLPPHDRILV